jgi:hypothetical protein
LELHLGGHDLALEARGGLDRSFGLVLQDDGPVLLLEAA